MGSRGRTSAAALAVVVPPDGQVVRISNRPASLTVAQARIWDEVIGSRAADLIAPEAYPVLVEYCRAADLANQIAAEMEKFGGDRTKNQNTLRRWSALQAMQDRAARGVALLAGKLRLTPVSQQQPKTAGRNANKGAKFKPWESES